MLNILYYNIFYRYHSIKESNYIPVIMMGKEVLHCITITSNAGDLIRSL